MDELNILTNSLKLCNKLEQTLEQEEQNQSESLVRSSNQHLFILSSTGVSKNDQKNFTLLNTSITNTDSAFTQTKLKKLPVAFDNTYRFLKGNLSK